MTQLDKIKEMLTMQNEFNISVLGDNWKNLDTPWYRAVWLECAEMLEQTNWKWWKHKDENINHTVLELVDIWHFGMSDMLVNFKEIDTTATIINNIFNCTDNTGRDIPSTIEDLVESTINNKNFNLTFFIDLCNALDITIDKLYALYIGKNVLNNFRQDYGYAKGHYIKVWNGREDNDYLIEFANQLDLSNDSHRVILWNSLRKEYDTIGG